MQKLFLLVRWDLGFVVRIRKSAFLLNTTQDRTDIKGVLMD